MVPLDVEDVEAAPGEVQDLAEGGAGFAVKVTVPQAELLQGAVRAEALRQGSDPLAAQAHVVVKVQSDQAQVHHARKGPAEGKSTNSGDAVVRKLQILQLDLSAS